MCGIAGVVGEAMESEVDGTCAMLGAMLHRGPDQSGVWTSEMSESVVVLGHRRLSIIDLSEAGRQPMVHERSGVVLTYNGECYNFKALREELRAAGHRFVSSSDSEVVLAAWVQWGVSAVERFRGMFAIAVWDPRAGSLYLVRDRLGIKPLYFARTVRGFAFASEVRALLASGRIDRRIDQAALESYLWHGFVPGPRTLVRGIRLLEPGTVLEVGSDGRIRHQHRYWKLSPSIPSKDPVEASWEAGEALREAIRLRLVSDVPLGVFLSGGIDSSVVAALAMESSSTRVKTFNIRFEEASYDESRFARRVAEGLDTEHHEITLTENIFRTQLDDALNAVDQPTFDALNTYFVSRSVREAGLTVALSGVGGDELFGGYPSFVELPLARHAARVARFGPRRLCAEISRLVSLWMMGESSEVPPQTRWGKLEDTLATHGDLVSLYQVSYALFTRRLQRSLRLEDQSHLKWGLYPERFEALTSQIESEQTWQAISRLELNSFVGERLLRDTDAASMAVSLEVRVPLLDHAFVESVFRLSPDVRYRPIRKKAFLKQFLQDHIDTAVFERDKAGFVLPLDDWCKQSLSDRLSDTFRDINLCHSLGMNAETVGRVWRTFENGGPGMYWSRVWSLFVVMDWCRRHRVTA